MTLGKGVGEQRETFFLETLLWTVKYVMALPTLLGY